MIKDKSNAERIEHQDRSPPLQSERRCCGRLIDYHEIRYAGPRSTSVVGRFRRRIRGLKSPPLVILRNPFATPRGEATVSGINDTPRSSLAVRRGWVSAGGLWSRKARAWIWWPLHMAMDRAAGCITRACKPAARFGRVHAAALVFPRRAAMR